MHFQSNAHDKYQNDAYPILDILQKMQDSLQFHGQPLSALDRYIGDQYIQHNPYVSDGKAPFVNYFTQYFKENPTAQNTIKRAIADGDLVVLHVHSKQNEHDKGQAIVDIFRIENGKIVEHWDVIQNIPEQSANQNSMF